MLSVNDAATAAPKRKKNASKKNKKSWRKNVDLDEVEDFLEDQRLEERLGGAFKERKDEDLFLIDKNVLDEPEKAPRGRLERRKELSEKPLKCFQHLEVSGGVKDPKQGRNRRKLPEERKNPLAKAHEEKLRQEGVLK